MQQSSSQPTTIDDIDHHMADAGSIERAALPIAWFVAWCAQHNLLSQQFATEGAELLLRLKYRELTPNEFFVPLCAGTFTSDHLSPEGVQFAAQHYADYMSSLTSELGAELYDQKDNWASYDAVAGKLSALYFGSRGRTSEHPILDKITHLKFWRKKSQ